MNTSQYSLEQSRFNMIEQQIRPYGVLDTRVIEAISNIKRESFMDSCYHGVAYAQVEVPIMVDGQKTDETMLMPQIEALFAEQLDLKPTDSVLEIGTGSGYQAALLSLLCNRVNSIEINSAIAAQAEANLKKEGISGVSIEVGDAHAGWGSTEYDAILVTGSLKSMPDSLKYQLAIGGRMVVVVGIAPLMTVYRIKRTSAANFETESIIETSIPALQGESVSSFKF